MPTPSATPSVNAGTSNPLVTGGDLNTLLIILGVIALFVIISPWLFTWRFKPYAGEPDGHGGYRQVGSFFAIPYITWWLLHYIVAVLGILAVVILAVDNILNAAVVSALLGGLFGFVLGTSARGNPITASTATPQGQAAPAPGLQLTSLNPNTGRAAGGEPVALVGTGFVPGSKVTFGTTEATAAVASPTVISAITPPGTADAAVDVIVELPDHTKTTATPSSRFRYGSA
jgi:hypothetical protein